MFSAIARLESLLRRRTPYSQADLRQIRSFLVLQYDGSLGSVVHATPFYEALKTAMPDAHVTVAASRLAASVLQNSPFVDRCVVTPQPIHVFRPALAAVRELLHTMPSGERCIVTTIGSRRPIVAILALLAGNTLRAGHTAAPSLYGIPLTFTPERGQIEGNLDILRAIGHEICFYRPRVFFTSSDEEYARSLLCAASEKDRSPRLVLVTQNSRGQRNQWPPERFRQVVRALKERGASMPIFVGVSDDEKAIDALRRDLPDPGISLAGKTTVPQLAAVLAQSDLVISLDTGPFHIARAVGLPGVVVAPAWQNPREWLPVDHPEYRVLRGQSISTAPADYRIEEIQAAAVIESARDLLQKFPPSSQARAARVEKATVP